MSRKVFSAAEIDEMPTIMDVVEQISALENKLALHFVSQIPSPSHLDEGRYSFVSDRDNHMVVRLMPMSRTEQIPCSLPAYPIQEEERWHLSDRGGDCGSSH